MSDLVFEDVGFGYGDRRLIDGLDLALEGSGLTALVGPNGAGKSTLLKLAAGLLPPDAGTVRLHGRALAGMPARARARAVGYLAPDGRSAWPMTVRSVVALGRAPWLKPLRRLSDADEEAIAAAMDRTGVKALAGRRFDTLSSGECARVLIARTLAGRAPLLVLDEPTAALDVRHQLGVMEILREAVAAGAQVLVAVHALDLAARYADRVLVLDGGRLAADGPPGAALSEDVVRDVFGVHAPGGIVATGLRAVAHHPRP
jgi:iron complex transport system ATP-binding protein